MAKKRNEDFSLSHPKKAYYEGTEYFISPPTSPVVKGIMLQYGIGRKQAEEWWEMH